MYVQGLAYSVSGGWNTTPADHVGLFMAGGETAKPAEFLTALQRVLQVLSLCQHYTWHGSLRPCDSKRE